MKRSDLKGVITDKVLSALEPEPSAYRLNVGDGLYFFVRPTGRKTWELRYKPDLNKWAWLGLGSYPEIGLKKARSEAAAARERIENGGEASPKKERARVQAEQLKVSANTFRMLAEEWYEYQCPRWAAATVRKARLYLDNDILPFVGDRPIHEITRPDLVELVRTVERRGTLSAAAKIRQWLNQIFRFGLAKGSIQSNPATDLSIVAAPAPAARHHPTVSLSELPELLQKVDEHPGSAMTKYAIHLLLLTAVRPGELRHARWCDIDLDAATWSIPAEYMKMRRPHLVPLPKQAVAILRELHALTGTYELVFAGRVDRNRPMSENTVNKFFADIGYKDRQTGHGFRHLLSTELNGHGYNKDWIERQLAHGDKDEIRATYNHAHYLDQRRGMMQWWADHIGQLEKSSNVIPVRFQRG